MAKPNVTNPFKISKHQRRKEYALFECEIIRIAAEAFHLIRNVEYQLHSSDRTLCKSCLDLLINKQKVKELISYTNDWYTIIATQKGAE